MENNGTATPGVDYTSLPAALHWLPMPSPQIFFVTPLGGNLSANQVSVVLTLTSSTNSSLTSLSNATVNILDHPINGWLRASFTAAQPAGPSVSGAAANLRR